MATAAEADASIPPIMGPTVHANTGKDIQSANGTPSPNAIHGLANEARSPARAPMPFRSQT